MPSRPRIAALVALAAVALAAGSAAWLLPRPEWPDTVSRSALQDALAADPSQPLSAERTDVVLVSVCTFRADHTEPYGYDRPTTPFLELLARRGVLFDRNLSQAPWTRPAMGTLVTGRWPRVLKLDNPGRGSAFRMVLAEDHTTLAEALATAGFDTYGTGSNPNLKARFGFAQGFADYDEPGHTYHKGSVPRNGARQVRSIVDRARALPDEKRLFSWLVLTESHSPRHRERRYSLLFRGGPRMAADYDQSLRYVDALLAELFVRYRRERPNVLFVVTGDHGEGLREPRHHGKGHGNHVYRSTVETPSIWYHPSLDGGRRVGGLSMNVDVAPTILDLLGLPALPEADGLSEAAAIRGARDVAAHDFAFAETWFRKAHKSTVIDSRWQLARTWAGDERRDALFAADDLGALHDLSEANPTETRRLAGVLDDWEARVAALAAGAAAAVEAETDEETQRMLEAMGYVE